MTIDDGEVGGGEEGEANTDEETDGSNNEHGASEDDSIETEWQLNGASLEWPKFPAHLKILICPLMSKLCEDPSPPCLMIADGLVPVYEGWSCNGPELEEHLAEVRLEED